MTTQALTYKTIQLPTEKLTPVKIFARLQGHKKFLLESSSKFIPKGKYSFLGSNPYQTLIGDGQQTIIKYQDGENHTSDLDILTYIKHHLPKLTIDLRVPFYGGAVGYIGYDAGTQSELTSHNDNHFPHSCLQVYRDVIVFDHVKQIIHLMTINSDHQPESVLDQRLDHLKAMLSAPKQRITKSVTPIPFQPNIRKEQFIHHVQQVQNKLLNSDLEQVVISQIFKGELTEKPFDYYCALRSKNPSPYMFYIEFSDHTVLGSSPESLLQTIGNVIITNPIAGTRPRGRTIQEDQQLEKSLINDPKEIAEHQMLVNLNEQELLQICDQESISFPVYQSIEKFQYVMHLVTEIQGHLKSNYTSLDALRACLPAGTVSGSPKQQAMKLIHQIEQQQRWVYGGSVGYINFNHDLNMALAIRCLTIKNNQAYLQTGAGIVKDSDPVAEYEETIHKAQSLMNLGK